QVSKGRALGPIAMNDWLVHVAEIFSLVADVSLLFEDAERSADGRVARRIGEGLLHVGRGRLAGAVEDVHDLTLATTQLGGWFHFRHEPIQADRVYLLIKQHDANLLACVLSTRKAWMRVHQERPASAGQTRSLLRESAKDQIDDGQTG